MAAQCMLEQIPTAAISQNRMAPIMSLLMLETPAPIATQRIANRLPFHVQATSAPGTNETCTLMHGIVAMEGVKTKYL
jgi:hypothetical protein